MSLSANATPVPSPSASEDSPLATPTPSAVTVTAAGVALAADTNIVADDTPTTSRITQQQQQQQQCTLQRRSGDEVDAIMPPKNDSSNNEKDLNAPEKEATRYGKCKWFNVAKGWGFITPNDGGQEVFVHQSVIQMSGFRSLSEQEEVEFECKQTERGLEATRVSGRQGMDCHGSSFRPRARAKRRFRRIRCYNCGEFANHIASKCSLGPQPKRCHLCKQEDHLFADCPERVTQTAAACTDTGKQTDAAQRSKS